MDNGEDSDHSDITSEGSSTGTIFSARRVPTDKDELCLVPSEVDISKEYKKDTVSVFNSSFAEFLHTKADMTLDELNRCLVLLGTSPNVSQFEPENVEISQLFINVHKLISTIESRSSLLWSALSFIEQAAQNNTARIALVQKFKYMEILSELLESLSNPDRILRVLKLIESLTYGINITWQEPYLKDLIKALVNFITGENEILISPALSILINLCYKNLPPVYLLQRCIKPEDLLARIEPYGILACKMSLLLENNLDGVMENDVLAFVKFTFSEINRALRSFNLALLRHTVEFFADMKANRTICMHFERYDKYPEDIQCILQYIIAVDNSPHYDVDVVKEAKRSWPQFVSLIFELLVHILDFKDDELTGLFPRMASCALKWIISEKAGTKSLELLTRLVNKDEKLKYLSPVFEDISKNIARALTVLDTIEPTAEQITALLKLLKVILNDRSIDNVFLEILKRFLFDSIFGRLLSKYEIKKKKIPIIPQPEVSMYIRALDVLADLSSWSTDYLWKSSLDNLMKSPIIQFVLAKAMLCEDSETCSLVFRLAKVNTFPGREASEKIVRQGPILLARSTSVQSFQDSACSVDSLPNNLTSFNAEKRINELIDKMTEAQKSNQIGNVLMADIMELFEYKITMCTNEERDLLSRLDECNSQVTSLSQKLTLMSAEVSRYQSQNFTLQMNIDRLQETVNRQIEENRLLKKSLEYHEMSLKEENSNQVELIAQIELKDAEIRALSNQLVQARSKLKEREDELQRLQEIITSERRQNNDLELCVKNLEILRDELQTKIMQQEQSIREHAEEIVLLEKENTSLEDNVQKAERALQEKTNLLEHYAHDLREVEEMRSRVVSIMKRKSVPS